MRSIAILGAGEIGAAAARALAEREVATTIALVDDAAAVAAGKALDITQSGPIAGWDTRVVSAGVEGIASADVVVVADRHGPDGEWTGAVAVELLRRFTRDTRAPLVFAGPRQHGLMHVLARELRFSRARLLGSAPEALASAARALAALAAGTSPDDVAVTVVGLPSRWTIAWNESRIGGAAATSALPPPVLSRVDAQIRSCWPPGPQALGSAAAVVVAGMAGGLSRRRTIFVVLDGELDVRGAVAAMPASLGASGLLSIHTPDLTPGERVALDSSIAAARRIEN